MPKMISLKEHERIIKQIEAAAQVERVRLMHEYECESQRRRENDYREREYAERIREIEQTAATTARRHLTVLIRDAIMALERVASELDPPSPT